jgi:hypothetical protein
MSLSTTISYVSLPPTLQRPPLHDGRSTPTEVIKLANQTRQLLNSAYETVFDFTTPGDNAYHNAWGAQLADGETWTIETVAVATGGSGTALRIEQETLVMRSGATVTVVSDVVLSRSDTATLVNFDLKWVVSSLYAYLQLRDDTSIPGGWRISLRVYRP